MALKNGFSKLPKGTDPVEAALAAGLGFFSSQRLAANKTFEGVTITRIEMGESDKDAAPNKPGAVFKIVGTDKDEKPFEAVIISREHVAIFKKLPVTLTIATDKGGNVASLKKPAKVAATVEEEED